MSKQRLEITDSRDVIGKAEKIIFPGVGHFGKAVKELKKRKLFDILKEKIKEGVPFLGICLGMQLLLEESEEARGIEGLAVIAGKVKRFDDTVFPVPHMGWNSVALRGARNKTQNKTIFAKIKNETFFYFAHSYYCQPQDAATVLAVTDYGVPFASALHKGNVWAVQFHPEKSQEFGLKVFHNFLTLC